MQIISKKEYAEKRNAIFSKHKITPRIDLWNDNFIWSRDGYYDLCDDLDKLDSEYTVMDISEEDDILI